MNTPGKSPKALIIGGGYSGIALANLLAQAGYRVQVFEKNESLGGRIHVVKQDGFTFDLGPSWYLMPEVFAQYYALFGKQSQQELDLIRFSPGYRVFFEQAAPIDIQGDLAKDQKTFEALEPGAGIKLKKYIQTSSLAYRTATRHFLYSTFEHPSDFLHRDVLRASPKMLSLIPRTLHTYVRTHFRSPLLQKILEYHMVFLGTSPFQAPALYTLMSHLDFTSGIFYPRPGMASLVDSLVQLDTTGRISYHCNSPVTGITVKGGRATGLSLQDGSHHTGDIVVSAADLHFTETQLLQPEHQSYPSTYWAKRQPGPSALLISLGVSGTLPQLLHHNLFLVDDWRENFQAIYQTKHIPRSASLYVCNPTKTDPSLAPQNHENLFILLPLPAGITYTKKRLDRLVKQTIVQLAHIIKQPDLEQRIVSQYIYTPHDFGDRYNAWAQNAFGGESHLLSQSVIFRTPHKSKKVKNLYYVGAGTLPGIGLPMCLISAQLTFKRIMNIRASGPLTKQSLAKTPHTKQPLTRVTAPKKAPHA